MEVDSKTKRAFTRSQITASLSEHNKSAVTDHAIQENHVIDWAKATVIDREPDCPTRWIRESVHIRKEGQQTMNQDEGSCQLIHAYDRFLDTTAGYPVKIQENWLPASSDEGLWTRSKRHGF